MTFLHPPYAYINCLSCFSLQLLFETILNQLSTFTPTKAEGFQNSIKCTHMTNFIYTLQSGIPSDSETTYIIFDHAEKLLELSEFLLPSLLKLDEFLPQKNIGLIFISSISWEKFRGGYVMKDPICIWFPPYSRDILFFSF